VKPLVTCKAKQSSLAEEVVQAKSSIHPEPPDAFAFFVPLFACLKERNPEKRDVSMFFI